jgi:hypothetical protein
MPAQRGWGYGGAVYVAESMADQEKRKVLVPIANGSEEIESVCIIDTLRRAGADVTGESFDSLDLEPHLD